MKASGSALALVGIGEDVQSDEVTCTARNLGIALRRSNHHRLSRLARTEVLTQINFDDQLAADYFHFDVSHNWLLAVGVTATDCGTTCSEYGGQTKSPSYVM